MAKRFKILLCTTFVIFTIVCATKWCNNTPKEKVVEYLVQEVHHLDPTKQKDGEINYYDASFTATKLEYNVKPRNNPEYGFVATYRYKEFFYSYMLPRNFDVTQVVVDDYRTLYIKGVYKNKEYDFVFYGNSFKNNKKIEIVDDKIFYL